LIGNAVKFTSAGHVLTSVTAQLTSPLKAKVVVSVEDTGLGIPANKLDRLFEKFSQVDGSASRKHGGTGLGLAISKQLVQLMGGRIGVRSEEGRGSTFWFELPLEVDAEAWVESTRAADLAGLRVLVVAAEEAAGRVLVRTLADYGMRAAALPRHEDARAALLLAVERIDPYHFAVFDGVAACAPLNETISVTLAAAGQSVAGRSVTKPVRQAQLIEELASAWVERRKPGWPVPGTAAADASRRFEDMKTALEQKFGPAPVRVLIAEDNIVNQKVAARMVMRLGFRADVAANGREAVEMFEMLPYDLIFMDCQMPEMDGYEAARTIREKERSDRRVAIVAMTADVLNGCRDRCIAAGMDDHVSKPVRMDDVFEALQKWVPVRV
jgi:CheY-like chemotaxis protein